MYKYINPARAFLRTPLYRKLMIIQMIMILVYTSILVRFIPLRFYYNRYIHENSDLQSRNMQPFGNQIVLYRRIMLLFPWKVTCMIESLSFLIYFKQKGIQIPLFIGVKTGHQMKAHAWNFNTNSQGFSAIDK